MVRLDHDGEQPASELGGLLRRRREQLGLSIRATSHRVGISSGYLVALEHGRNPSTGRPPTPSPPILAALGRVLGIEMATLLDLSGAPTTRSVHLLLYQTGSVGPPALDAAGRVFGGRVQRWIEVADPRRPAPDAYDAARVLEAVAKAAARARRPAVSRRFGLIFGTGSRLVRSIENPRALLASEATWEGAVAAACRDAVGEVPAANVCVYREDDLHEIRDRVDPLESALDLVKTHPLVAVQDPHGAVAVGPAAIEVILEAARPGDVSASTWASLAAAAALGLQRQYLSRAG